MMKKGTLILFIAILTSCSTVKVLKDGEQRLDRNNIVVTKKNTVTPNQLMPYLKQKAGGWSPLLCVYNWEDGKGKGWDKFVHKLGTPPVIFDSTAVSGSINSLTDHLSYIGFYNSKVTAKVDTKKKEKIVKVTYTVTPGKRIRVSEIKYELPDNAEFCKDFCEDTCNSIIRKGSFLVEDLMEKESARAASAMRNKGYYDFTKYFFSFEADTVSERSKATLLIKVRDYSRNDTPDKRVHFHKYDIGAVTLQYPEDLPFRNRILSDLNVVKTGSHYSEQLMKDTYRRFNTVSLFNSVGVHLAPHDSNIVDCNIMLNKGKIQGFKIGLEASINTSGLFGISPEISYTHRNIFHGGEVLSLAVSTNHQFKISDSNIRSNEVSVSASLLFPRFLPFSTKRFKGADIPKSEIKVSYNYQKRPEYERHIANASFGWLGNLNNTFFYQARPLSFSYVGIPYMSESFYKSIEHNYYLLSTFSSHVDFGVNATLFYSTSGNDPNPKYSHWNTRLQTDFSGNVLSLFNKFMKVNGNGERLLMGVPYSQYVKGEYSISRTDFFGMKRKHSLAMRFLIGAGYAYGNSTSIPYEKALYSGGANSLRGWVARTVGPGDSKPSSFWTIPSQFGEFKLEGNIEYRFDIVWKLAGAVFVDAGNVWMLGYNSKMKNSTMTPEEKEKARGMFFTFDNFYRTIAADWGIGLRLDFSVLVLRVDMGLRFYDPARDNSKWVGPKEWFKSGNYTFHFGVGFPF